MRPTTRTRGFTLIEMVVTMGIVIMAAGFLAPAVATIFQNRKLDNAGTLISTVLNEARNRAVTSKQAFQVVFLRDQVRLYRTPKKKDPGGWEKVQAYDPESTGTLKYNLHFARLEYQDIPTRVAMVIEGSSLDDSIPTRDDIFVTFRPDGTVDFGKYLDIPTYEFKKDAPDLSDIEIYRDGQAQTMGYLDIRATGRTEYKVAEKELE